MRELEAFYEQMDREWYSDDPEWQKSHQDADSARAEQRAAKDYREKQEKAQQARDLSTQAAMDEKLAMRKSLDSNNAVTYNKYTGEYYGISTNVGVSLVSADLHGSIEHSTIINMKNLFEQLNGM